MNKRGYCDTCKFEQSQQCRRYPPTFDDKGQSRWPYVIERWREWCGEYKPKKSS